MPWLSVLTVRLAGASLPLQVRVGWLPASPLTVGRASESLSRVRLEHSWTPEAVAAAVAEALAWAEEEPEPEHPASVRQAVRVRADRVSGAGRT